MNWLEKRMTSRFCTGVRWCRPGSVHTIAQLLLAYLLGLSNEEQKTGELDNAPGNVDRAEPARSTLSLHRVSSGTPGSAQPTLDIAASTDHGCTFRALAHTIHGLSRLFVGNQSKQTTGWYRERGALRQAGEQVATAVTPTPGPCTRLPPNERSAPESAPFPGNGRFDTPGLL
jgi:hypothetical protein